VMSLQHISGIVGRVLLRIGQGDATEAKNTKARARVQARDSAKARPNKKRSPWSGGRNDCCDTLYCWSVKNKYFSNKNRGSFQRGLKPGGDSSPLFKHFWGSKPCSFFRFFGCDLCRM